MLDYLWEQWQYNKALSLDNYFNLSSLGSMLYLIFLSYVFFHIFKYELFCDDVKEETSIEEC